jgi:hypothetical protein
MPTRGELPAACIGQIEYAVERAPRDDYWETVTMTRLWLVPKAWPPDFHTPD